MHARCMPLLTGRVTAVTGTARLDAATGKYVYLGDLAQKSKGYAIGAYASDSWRASSTLTLNGGLRWDVQLPFTPVSQTYSTTTLEDMCGVSGIGSGPLGRPCNMFQSYPHWQGAADVLKYASALVLKTTENLGSTSAGVDTNVQASGCARHGDPD